MAIKTKSMRVTLDGETAEAVREICKAEGVGASDLARAAIRRLFAERERMGSPAGAVRRMVEGA